MTGPAPGAFVDNVATVNALDSLAAPFTATSNTVRAHVTTLEALSWDAPQGTLLAPGASGIFLQRLTNTSNVPVDVRLDVTNDLADGFDLVSFTLARDDDADGMPSAGDSAFAAGGVIHLPLDGTVRVLVGFTVLPTAPAAADARFQLLATTVEQNAQAAVVDTVHTGSGGAAALRTELAASRTTVEIGDALDYTARVTNSSAQPAGGTLATVSLPPGFAYLGGTARGDSAGMPDPAGGAGPTLTFDLGALGPSASVTFRYRVRVGPGVPVGEAVARASAAASTVTSNVATAAVVVLDDVFADEAGILGTVFVDQNSDGRRGAGDFGLAGVRLVLDDGTFAVTDGNGQYSLYGLTPRTHGLRVDPTSLPEGAKLAATDHRDDGTPGLRFVDLQRGDFQRADFAIAADSTMKRQPPPEKFPEMIAGDGPLGAVLRRPLSTQEGYGLPGDSRSRPTSAQWGEVDAPSAHAPETPSSAGSFAAPGAGNIAQPPRYSAPLTAAARAEEQLLADLGDTWQPFGFVGRMSGDTLAADQATFRVAGRADFSLELRVNGEQVPESRIGLRRTNVNAGLQTWDYVGVRLNPGVNTLQLIERAADGTTGARGSITVMVPDRLVRVEIEAPARFGADGRSVMSLQVRAVDERGVPVAGRAAATFATTRGELQMADADPATPGMQTVLENGTAEIRLRAPADPGVATVTAVVAGLKAERQIEFVPDLRPLFLVGSFEWRVGFNHLLTGAPSSRTHTGFEQSFQSLTTESSDGRVDGGIRGSLFARGRLVRDVLLTLGFDSDRPEDLRRFRDIQPDAFYPLYGDASAHGYTAQSTGRLYARLDRPGASLMYGDFVTMTAGGARSLSTYSRSLTGLQQHYENHRMRMDSFASQGRARRTVEELRGLGVSGPYAVSNAPIVENSEQVEILVRDRNQPGIVRSASLQTRFVDYDMDPWTGRILFKQPVPSHDAELNPVSIRVGYESREGGDAYWVGGLETRVRVEPRLEVGGSAVADGDAANPYRLGSVFAGADVGAGTHLEGEFARTEASGSGANGWRLEAVHDRPDAQGRFWAANTDTGFANPHTGYAPGRTELGMKWSSRIDDRSLLLSEGMFTSEAPGRVRGGFLLAVDQRLSGATRGELGVRIASTRDPAREQEDPPSVALRGKLTAQMPSRPELSGFAEIEQDIVELERRLAAVGGEYRFKARGRLYARHELSSTLSGPYGFDSNQRRLATVLGVDANLTPDSRVFSEYRLADAFAARDAEAVLGLRNAWRVGAYRIGTSFERVASFDPNSSGPSTALTGSLEAMDDPDVKVSTRMEFRTSRASDGMLGTVAGAVRANRSWSWIGRALADVNRGHDRGNTVRMRNQLGFAYRNPYHDALDLLGRYELRLDRDPLSATERNRHLAHVLSLHGTGRIVPTLETSFAWAAKRAIESSDGLATASNAQWVHGRLARTFAKKWDAGVHASTLFGDGAHDHGLGAEIGYQVQQGTWMSAGWNRLGYYDRDLPDEAYTRAGFYLRLRTRFDESVLRRNGGSAR